MHTCVCVCAYSAAACHIMHRPHTPHAKRVLIQEQCTKFPDQRTTRINAHNVPRMQGSFSRNTGLFLRNTGLCCENTGLFCGNTGLFCGSKGLFCGNTGLFFRNIGVFLRAFHKLHCVCKADIQIERYAKGSICSVHKMVPRTLSFPLWAVEKNSSGIGLV